MIYNNKKKRFIMSIVILAMVLQLLNPLVANYSFAETGEDLGNIFTFDSLRLNDKDTGTIISEDDPIDVDNDTSVFLKYDWKIEDSSNTESGDWSEIQVPDAFEKLGQEFSGKITITDNNANVEVGDYTLDTNGKLRFVFDENIEEYDTVVEGYIVLGLEFNLETFQENVIQEITFEDTQDKSLKVTVVPSQIVTEIDKEGIPDADTDPKNIEWTVDVVNVEDDTISEPIIWDNIPDGLELTNDSIEIYDLDVGYDGDNTQGSEITTGPAIRIGINTEIESADIEVEFQSMESYKGYRIKYTTRIEDYNETSFSNEAHLVYNSNDITKDITAVATISNIVRSDFIEKSGNALDNDKIQWSIDINKPGGFLTNAIVEDNLPNGLTLESDSIEIYDLTKNGNNWEESLNNDLSNDNNNSTFPISLGALSPDDTYRIKFTTDIDYTQVNDGDYIQDNSFENTAILKDDGTVIGEAQKTVTINRDPILRKTGKSNVTYDDKTLSWTIHVNEANHPIDHAIVKDTIPADLTITKDNINVFDDNAVELNLADGDILVEDNDVTIKLGDIRTEYRKIVYTVDVANFNVDEFTNSATLTGLGVGTDGNTSTKKVSPAKNTYTKSFEGIDYNNKIMNWEIQVNPKREAISVLRITDTFPNNGLILLPDSLEVKLGNTVLIKDTDYTLDPNNNGYHEGFIIEFTGDKLPLNNNLLITYTTSFDPEEVVENDSLTENTDSNQEYKNKALFQGTTINSNTINTSDEVSKTMTATSWNTGKKEGKLISLNSNGNLEEGWKSGNERKIKWEVYINYLEEELGTGIVVEDILAYEGQIDQDSIEIYEYSVAADGDTNITNSILEESNYNTVFSNENKELTINFDDQFNVDKRYVIVFTTSVPDVSEGTYSNTATLKVDQNDYPYTASIDFDEYDNVLSKEALSISDNKVYTDQEVNWNITINESLSVIEDAEIIDTISSGMLYKNDSLKVYRLENSQKVLLTEGDTADYTLVVDTSQEDTVLTVDFNDPIDEYTYEIEYTTLVIEEDGNVNNEVKFNGTNIVNETKESQVLSASKFSWVGGVGTKEGTIKLRKVDESGNLINTGNADFEFGYIFNDQYYQIGEETFSTENGILEIDIPNLDRTYYFEEISSPEGYLILEQGVKYELLTDSSDDDKIYEIEVENKSINGNIEFSKVDEWNSPIEGATFAIYDASDTEFNNELSTAISDEKGDVIFESVAYGNYIIREKTPAEGYSKNLEVLEASIGSSDDNKIIYAKPIGSTDEGKYSLENEIEDGSSNIKIIKVDASNNESKLSGAVFEIYDSSDLVVDTLTTDDNGSASIVLVKGEYTIKEIIPPSNYYLNNEIQNIDIGDESPKLIEVVFENRRIRRSNSNDDDEDEEELPEDEELDEEEELPEEEETDEPIDEPIDEPDEEETVIITLENVPKDGIVNVPEDSTPEVDTPPKNGTVDIDDEGNWTYTPEPDFIGDDDFVIKIKKPDGTEEDVLVEITVEEVPLGLNELPQTGDSIPWSNYLLGGLVALLGIVLLTRRD